MDQKPGSQKEKMKIDYSLSTNYIWLLLKCFEHPQIELYYPPAAAECMLKETAAILLCTGVRAIAGNNFHRFAVGRRFNRWLLTCV